MAVWRIVAQSQVVVESLHLNAPLDRSNILASNKEEEEEEKLNKKTPWKVTLL